MLIINADDWGRSRPETEAAQACFERGAITSVSAMVYMQDSVRAAEIAGEIGVNAGLHLNLTEHFTAKRCPSSITELHNRIARFLKRSKYALLLYHPLLRSAFRYVYQAQVEEFLRLYGRAPSHIDGHQHMHLCSNMLIDYIIPTGQRVRRSFSFSRGEKGLFNRSYRNIVDKRLSRRYETTDFFFSLQECLQTGRLARIIELGQTRHVELMTHPIDATEYRFLMGDTCRDAASVEQSVLTGARYF